MPIVPDTKDWTWVLVRPCRECGFDASAYTATAVATALRSNAAEWIVELEAPGVRQRPAEDRWSPLEYACHVRDVFLLFAQRLELMLHEDDPEFENWDQDATALAERYDLQEPREVSVALVAGAEDYATRLDTVADDVWDRPGTRSNGSHFTVASLALYSLHDPIHHLADVRAGRQSVNPG